MKTLVFLMFMTINPNSFDHFEKTAPSFPGGNKALQSFIGEHLVYPLEARKNGLEGDVKFKLFIDEKGKTMAIRILESDNYCFEIPALKVIEAMPKWIPAKLNGKSIKAAVNLKISFELN